MSEESLKFQVTLSATHWGKLPQFSIWLNDENVVSNASVTDTEVIEFSKAIQEGHHELKIRLENKDQKTDTVIENGEIVNDMLLNIVDVSIDNISLGNLLWDAEYQLDQPQIYNSKTITKLDHCVNLGWNGAYVLKFSSPFYIWLLEKL